MKYVYILVEGQTEEEFVREVLQPHLLTHDVFMQPTLATTRRTAQQHFKGGVVSYDQVKYDLQRLLRNSNAALVTTFIDYYGLAGKDFPGWDAGTGTVYTRVQQLEQAVANDINHPKLLPFFMLHEFEAFLFVSPPDVARNLLNETADAAEKMMQASARYASVEEINLTDPPSKRLKTLFPAYEKGVEAILIVLDIPLVDLRAACPHFAAWLTKIENVGKTP